MIAIPWDDLMPLLLVVGAALGVGLYNVLTGSRPRRRDRNQRPTTHEPD